MNVVNAGTCAFTTVCTEARFKFKFSVNLDLFFLFACHVSVLHFCMHFYAVFFAATFCLACLRLVCEESYWLIKLKLVMVLKVKTSRSFPLLKVFCAEIVFNSLETSKSQIILADWS